MQMRMRDKFVRTMRVTNKLTIPATRITIPIFHTTGGSVSWRTIINPMQMRMRDKFVRTIRQQTPLVLGQKGLGADIVSTARPAFMVFLDLTVLIPLAAVMFVPLLLTLFELRAVFGLYPTPIVEGGLEGGTGPWLVSTGSPCLL